jgi:hypothetical protein
MSLSIYTSFLTLEKDTQADFLTASGSTCPGAKGPIRLTFGENHARF